MLVEPMKRKFAADFAVEPGEAAARRYLADSRGCTCHQELQEYAFSLPRDIRGKA
jgi:hypothetical protein